MPGDDSFAPEEPTSAEDAPGVPDGRPAADSDDATAGTPDGTGRAGFTWNPDGEDVARALVARTKAAQTGRAVRRSTGNQGGRTRRERRSRRSPGSGWSGPGSDDRDPQPVSAAMDRLVGEHGWDEELAVHGVVARWEQVVGAEIAAHVTPEGYADHVLTVRADSTAWATQVRLLAADLVAKLNREIGDGTVTRVSVLGPQAPTWRKGLRSVRGRGPRDTYG